MARSSLFCFFSLVVLIFAHFNLAQAGSLSPGVKIDNRPWTYTIVSLIFGAIFMCVGFVVTSCMGIYNWYKSTKYDELDQQVPVLRARAEEIRTKIIVLEGENSTYESRIRELKQLQRGSAKQCKRVMEDIEKEINHLRTKGLAYAKDHVRPYYEDNLTQYKLRAEKERQKFENLMKKTVHEIEVSRAIHRNQANEMAKDVQKQHEMMVSKRPGRLKRIFNTTTVKKNKDDIERGEGYEFEEDSDKYQDTKRQFPKTSIVDQNESVVTRKAKADAEVSESDKK